MPGGLLLAIVLSTVAAFLFGLAAALQHHEAQAVAHGVGRRGVLLSLAQRLPRSRVWLAGWAANFAGFAVQAAALYFGSVPLVQVILVTQLIFALPLATVWARRWPSERAWLSAAFICAGVMLFIIVYGGSSQSGVADRNGLALTVLSTAVVAATLVRASAYWSGSGAAALLATAAGLCYATSAALMKVTVENLVEHGIAATAVDWPGYTLAVSSVASVVLGQWAYATGSLPTAVAAMTITNPVASYVIAIVVFGVSPATTPPRLAGVLMAGVLISAGVVGLAHSEFVGRPSEPRRSVRQT